MRVFELDGRSSPLGDLFRFAAVSMQVRIEDAETKPQLRPVFLIVASLLALSAAYAFGIWLGLWNTYGDAAPSRGRIHFALVLTAIPFLLPLAMNIASLSMLRNRPYETTGILLFVCSIVSAVLIGVFVVPMGNF